MRMDPQPLRDVIQPERIGQRQPVAAGHRRLVGVEDLVNHPGGHQDAEDPGCMIAQADQHGEDHDMRNRLGILPVVHGAHAGNDAQQAAKHGMWRAGKDRGGHTSAAAPEARSRSARHASQNTEPPTLRTHSLHNGLPQNWQKADEGTSG